MLLERDGELAAARPRRPRPGSAWAPERRRGHHLPIPVRRRCARLDAVNTIELSDLAPDFVTAAHTIVYCAVGSVDAKGRPTSRVMHPIWEWDGERLTGWLTTTPSPKLRQLAAHPYVSCAYYDSWAVAAVADGRVEPVADDAERTRIWELLGATPPPLGYEPDAIGVPGWDGPTAPGFVMARVDPWRVQVRRATPGVGVELRTWHAATP